AHTQQVGTSVSGNVNSGGNASASYTLPGGTAVGTYYLVAVYNPGSDFTGSSDSTNGHTLSVSQAATTTEARNADATFASVNQSLTLRATVSPDNGTGQVTEGSVTFTVYSDSAHTQQVGMSVSGNVN